MKVLTINHDRCNLCGEELSPKLYGAEVTEVGIEKLSAVFSKCYIPFHANCWIQASDSSACREFTYKEWIDLTGDEWDTWGLVRFCQKGEIIGYHYKSEWVSDHEVDELINS